MLIAWHRSTAKSPTPSEVFSQQIWMATQSACSMRHRLQLRNYFITVMLHFIILLLKSANQPWSHVNFNDF
jgi:hypothetical protein